MSEAPRNATPDPGDTARAARGGWVEWLERRINLSELFSLITHFGLVYTPVDTRKPLREVLREIGSLPVTAYARWPQVLGVLAALLFALQTATGVLLAYYYRPTPEAAFESTRTIVRDLPWGWFLHEMHAWGAYLLVAVVALRLMRLFWDGLYRAPRELLWFAAVAMAWLVLQMDFTGRLLTWNAQSYWSTVRGMEVVWALPVAGPILAFFLGGRVVNEDVLIRFYVLHVIVLPAFYAACIYVTFGTLRRVGLSYPSAAGARVVTSFRAHLVDLLILTVLLFAVLVTLTTLLPFGFLAPADPYTTPAGVRPPWYMLATYALLQRAPVPMWLSGGVMLAAAFGVLLLPLWVRGDGGPRHLRRTRLWGVVALAVWIVLGILGATLDRP